MVLRRRSLYRPAGIIRGALLWIHGGGLVLGKPEINDELCCKVALDLGIAVISARYRLAPNHPYPAGLDDCHAAWRWLLDHAEDLGVPADRLAIGGESAGGGLAAALAQRLRDEGGPRPVAQILVYPMLDDRTAARTDVSPTAHEVWNNHSNHFGWSSYLGREPGSPGVPPHAAPARATDLSGLPPAWVGVGTRDLFLDEDVDYARRLEEAGVQVAVERVPGAWHGFFALAGDTEVSKAFYRSAADFLSARLG